MPPRLRQKACWCCCAALFHCKRAFQLQKYVTSPAGQQALLEPPPDTRRQRSGSGDIKGQSVSAHIYRQTDLWWNFKEIIHISPPLNRRMKFSSTMKHTKKYILSQINQPGCSQAIDFEVHFQHFGECVHVPETVTSCANSFLTFEGDRLVHRITFEGTKWQY